MSILQYIIGGLILATAVVLIFLVSKQQGKRKLAEALERNLIHVLLQFVDPPRLLDS